MDVNSKLQLNEDNPEMIFITPHKIHKSFSTFISSANWHWHHIRLYVFVSVRVSVSVCLSAYLPVCLCCGLCVLITLLYYCAFLEIVILGQSASLLSCMM